MRVQAFYRALISWATINRATPANLPKNISMRFCKYLLFMLLILMSTGSDAKAVKPAVPLKTDTSIVALRRFDARAIKAYSKQPEFSYTDVSNGPSLWTRFWRWFWHLFDWMKNARNNNIMATILRYVFILLGIAAIVFLVFKLIGMDIKNVFGRRSAPAKLEYSEFTENIHEIDFDAEIEKAMSNHNYRLAVRLLYLKSLKQLSDAGLIKWQIDKTNSTYIDELSNTEQRQAFSMLTRQFEFVWYGEFLIDNQVYQQIYRQFKEFKTRTA
jgi:hypothetical protein